MSIFAIFDIETDGLYEQCTKIHCLSYQLYKDGDIISSNTIIDYNSIESFFKNDYIFVGHNIIRYDIPVVEKLLSINLSKIKHADTLGISWYLFPNYKIHGLENWGDLLGVEKPKIDDWENLKQEEYIYRCETDVEINTLLFRYFFNILSLLYSNTEDILRTVSYLNFKLDCIKEQEFEGIYLDVDKCNKHLQDLTEMFIKKTEVLSEAMPEKLGKVLKTKPKILFKKDGNLSTHGQKWVDYTNSLGIPFDTEEVREKPNPGSNNQLKEWLYSLDWKPVTFQVSKNTGKKVEKVSLPFGQGICPSVKALYDKEPILEELEGYYKIKHRIGIFKSYLKNLKGEKVYASANGFTNTLRLTHREPVVNLPKPSVFYGKECREVLTKKDDTFVMCGSDVSSLEDNTKQHYIFFYDPEYVRDMQVPGFDPHVDIGVLAGLITEEESKFLKWSEDQEKLTEEEKIKAKKIKKNRGIAKSANFAATYGAGGPKIAETAKIPLNDGIKLHSIYWKRNSAISKVVKNTERKTISFNDYYLKPVITLDEEGNEIKSKERWVREKNQKWIFNPVSKFWMFLKDEKDVFSTLNQSSGVFVFDSWLRNVRNNLKNLKIPVIMQYHDELLLCCKTEDKNKVDEILHNSMKQVNDVLKLNIKIKISTDWGNNYAECH